MEIRRAVYNTSLYKDGERTHDSLVLLVRQIQLHSFIRYYGLRDPIRWRLNFELMELSLWKLG